MPAKRMARPINKVCFENMRSVWTSLAVTYSRESVIKELHGSHCGCCSRRDRIAQHVTLNGKRPMRKEAPGSPPQRLEQLDPSPAVGLRGARHRAFTLIELLVV